MNESIPSLQTSPDKYSTMTYTTSTAAEFAKTENELNQLQTEIMNQGKDIEQFIKVHSSKHQTSNTFHALEMLFELFKSELSMNLMLRRSLMQEKANGQQTIEYIEKLENEKKEFFAHLSKGSTNTISDYDQVIAFVIDQMKIADNSLSHNKKNKSLRHSIKKLENEIQSLKSQNEKVGIENQNLKQTIHNLQNSTNSVSKYQVENEQLKQQLSNLKQTFEEQQAQISLDLAKINARNEVATQALEAMKIENAQLKQQNQNLDIANNKQSIIIEQLSAKLVSKQEKMKSLKTEFEQIKSNVNNFDNLQGRLQESNEKITKITAENEKLIKKMSEYKTSFDNVELLMKENEKLKKKNEKLKTQVQKNEKAVSLLSQSKDAFIMEKNKAKEYKSKINYLENQIKEQKVALSKVDELKSKIQYLEDANQKIINNIQNNAKEQSKTVTLKLQTLEAKFSSIQSQYASMSNENKRLYSQLRQSSQDIQKLESENARLSTTLERLNREMIDSKSEVSFPGKNSHSNESSYSGNMGNVDYQSVVNPMNYKPKTYYIDDDIEESPVASDFDRIQPVISTQIKRIRRNSKDSLNSGNSLNPEIQEEMNSLKSEIYSLRQQMGRTE